jgi:elongation factor Ts
VTAEAVKTLRQMTGAGFIECKTALEEANGDLKAAVEDLRKKGIAKGRALSDKRGTAGLNQGLVETYVHPGGRVGVMIEINCATDFVARTQDFKDLARTICMQIAAMDPEFVGTDDVPEGFSGNLKEAALLEQSYVRDQSKQVKDVLAEAIGKLGENIRVRRFIRYVLAN